MTEIAEGVSILMVEMQRDQQCEYRPDDGNWKCKLNGDSSSLTKNLDDHCGVPKPITVTSIKDVSDRCWPSQAHHLIPWQQLLRHPVTQWLCETPPHAPAKLSGDNDYSVDHGMNGKFMPYASYLDEWKTGTAKQKQQIANKVMGVAGIQLHQGPHSYKQYGIGEAGYKSRVAEYLGRIHDHSITHYDSEAGCGDCKSKRQNDKVPPRRNLVRFMDLASTRLEVDINLGRIFVSRRAAGFAEAGGVTG